MNFLEEFNDLKIRLLMVYLLRGLYTKMTFTSIGGHDPLYAPQSKEDSDIFNRFKLAGYELIQTWQGYVYHMTCRGSRFKDGAKEILMVKYS